jgi:hypothetical protein
LYALFVFIVARSYVSALSDWWDMDADRPPKSFTNKMVYEKFHRIITMRVESTQALLDVFKKNKLRLDGVTKLSTRRGDSEETAEEAESQWHDFKLHLYLTEGLGKSMEYLVQISLTTNLWLALCALIVAIFAHVYQLAFMFFLPPFVIIGFIILTAGYFVSRHYISLSEDPKHDTEAKYVNIYNYCRAVQVILYCMFYSFARLLLSGDIFVHYPGVYFGALITLLLVLLILGLFGGKVMKETTCALILPPHVSPEQTDRSLAATKSWYTAVNCHECGTRQRPLGNSWSKGYAGDPAKPPISPTTTRSGGSFARDSHERKFSSSV